MEPSSRRAPALPVMPAVGWVAPLLLLAALASTGCNVIGAGAQFLTRPGDTEAAYHGLAGQTVAVLVWVDRGPALDYPSLQADLAKSLTLQLRNLTTPKSDKEKDQKKVPDDLKGAQYRDPVSVLRFQQNHPEFEGMRPEDIASRLGVSRVIYVEVYNFQTRSNLSVELLRGTIQSKVQVLEVSMAGGAKTAKSAYTEPDLRVNFPAKDVQAAQGATMSEQQVYQQTINEFVNTVTLRFYKHESD